MSEVEEATDVARGPLRQMRFLGIVALYIAQ